MSLDRRLSVPVQCDDLCEGGGDARVAETVYFGLHQGLTAVLVGIVVGARYCSGRRSR